MDHQQHFDSDFDFGAFPEETNDSFWQHGDLEELSWFHDDKGSSVTPQCNVGGVASLDHRNENQQPVKMESLRENLQIRLQEQLNSADSQHQVSSTASGFASSSGMAAPSHPPIQAQGGTAVDTALPSSISSSAPSSFAFFSNPHRTPNNADSSPMVSSPAQHQSMASAPVSPISPSPMSPSPSPPVPPPLPPQQQQMPSFPYSPQFGVQYVYPAAAASTCPNSRMFPPSTNQLVTPSLLAAHPSQQVVGFVPNFFPRESPNANPFYPPPPPSMFNPRKEINRSIAPRPPTLPPPDLHEKPSLPKPPPSSTPSTNTAPSTPVLKRSRVRCKRRSISRLERDQKQYRMEKEKFLSSRELNEQLLVLRKKFEASEAESRLLKQRLSSTESELAELRMRVQQYDNSPMMSTPSPMNTPSPTALAESPSSVLSLNECF
eukprot:CAMPEP_0201489548 /NCGR_PEP_ID=MMETSP0151_2-20130828/22872_1 /ASSEMBLY_ACC=CAM_ASM_000257 /TAXON_ID=200890 /ORGANISM="Paramoeba atlantica, Strain 621/1 / CCAP 1560/9" /LENGTH=433 /DNA_ID=CAMNT_0047875175 /DNA_START=132 /DNA_END=1433 /DNA_ORIENTATION=-